MAVIEDLTDDECALWAILQDGSGLDAAEFTWYDAERPDGCWRAWPYQWKWFRCLDPLQIDQCARSVGKSLSIQLRACIFPFVHPGQEMVVTAPEGNHLDAVTDLIETQLGRTRLTREMLSTGRSGVKHRPFHVNFANGARIMGRIPQRDGKGVKGVHPIWLELDEAQDYPEAGWTELNETLKRGFEGATWRAHGVTRGVRDKFYQFTQDPKWKVHSFTAMHRPNWSDGERAEKIAQYGGRDDPDYKRNILGQHGDQMSPLFVLHRLMICVDDQQESDYNANEYMSVSFNDAYLREMDMDVEHLLQFPDRHRTGKRTFWAGMDVGFMNHPSEILVFTEELPTAKERDLMKRSRKALPPEGQTRLRLVTRINMVRVKHGDQVKAILAVLGFYKPKAFSMDKTGLGLPLFQELQEINPDELVAIKGYGFSEKRVVDFDQTKGVEESDTYIEDAGIKRNVLEYSSDKLRELVDNQRLWLPWDTDLLGEFQGQTFKVSKTALDQYGKKIYSAGRFHALDAARMAVLGWAQYGIEDMIDRMENDVGVPVLDAFVML